MSGRRALGLPFFFYGESTRYAMCLYVSKQSIRIEIEGINPGLHWSKRRRNVLPVKTTFRVEKKRRRYERMKLRERKREDVILCRVCC